MSADRETAKKLGWEEKQMRVFVDCVVCGKQLLVDRTGGPKREQKLS